MSGRDAELDRLLVGEIERRLPIFSQPNAPVMDLRAALHSLKGSSGMAGHTELALVIGQLGVRLRSGAPDARVVAARVIGDALERLRAGLPSFGTSWPEPPPPLEASAPDPRYAAEYHSAMRDCLGELDQALASSGDPAAALAQAQRTVHSMKGGSAAVGDDVTAWYCHGLEARLRAATGPSGPTGASDALVELSRHRVLLALLIEDPVRGLEGLRALSAPPVSAATATAPAAARAPSAPPTSAPPSALPPPCAARPTIRRCASAKPHSSTCSIAWRASTRWATSSVRRPPPRRA